MSRVTFVFDEGPGAGLGHRRRMEVLARAFAELGYECELRSGGTEAVSPIVVVDSYLYRADDPTRFNGEVVVAVDDLLRQLCVDIVIDPSPGAERGKHRSADLVLAGARYALVEPAPPCEPGDEVRRVLVTTGATDSGGAGSAIAAAISSAVPGVEVRLVVGAWGSQSVPAGVEAVHAPQGLADELAAADLVVTAGGVTLLESLLRGLPTVAVPIAANQETAVRSVAASGAALRAELHDVAEAVEHLVRNHDERRALAARARASIDANGARRVATEVARVAVARQRRPA
jgi:UDP-2,4-diacetamido-2,4,6-trideoxy-beta-L-altropyranose hydrolase